MNDKANTSVSHSHDLESETAHRSEGHQALKSDSGVKVYDRPQRSNSALMIVGGLVLLLIIALLLAMIAIFIL
jgi:hypothetical protein